MTDFPVRDPMRRPTHPGAILREDVLPGLRLGVTDAARKLCISRQALHAILSEKASVTPDMAVRIGKFCGNGADLWLRMQMTRDLWEARQRMAEIVKAIQTMEAA